MCPDEAGSPEDAFAALGNEIRLSVLEVLSGALDAGERHLEFTEIYDRVDVDSTSQLAYHLGLLEGTFLRRTAEGYVLTRAGDRIVRIVRSGMYTERPSFEDVEVDGRCPSCSGTVLAAEYRDPFLVVACAACDETVVTFNLPPAESAGRTPLEVLDSCNRRVHHEYAMALEGTCSLCGGLTDVEVAGHDAPNQYTCTVVCRRCDLTVYAPLEVRLFYHPAVVAFYWGHDVDIARVPLWGLPTYIEPWEVTRLDEAPLRIAVTVSHEGETLRTVVDDDLTVSLPDRAD